MDLPKPDVVRSFVEQVGEQPLYAAELRWDACDRVWHFPDGVSLKGPAPTRFGIAIQRLGENSYHVRVLWNRLTMSWDSVTRLQIMTGSLTLLLRALDIDVWELLHQPIDAKRKVA